MKIKILLSIIALSFFVSSCYRAPNEAIFVEDLDLVITNYDENRNYGSYTTFGIADSFSLASNDDDIDEQSRQRKVCSAPAICINCFWSIILI